ncbi:apolipoprotein N-acyltransferase [Hydrogenivirga sp. 128-5-R1-1]|uniref:apolipoprotein N-acyltransferase n=1 Tax=Hydrogenivirga sp. 128-5-R1-1 TaxID=392423 RepID=UPI00015EF94F|nr:apolipoprotein N-acyltransferase [Hydrogenivirga sp. 128-5-R1-1]EDP75176.1 apolipoprotein N-acyltransferase [Hydrogenivirga sp. 128-5-R1-1]
MSHKGLKKVGLPLLSGSLFYLAFSKLSLWFLLFPSLLILSYLRTPSAWFLAGVFSFLPSLFWIRIAMLEYGGVLPVVAYSLIALLVVFLVSLQFLVVFHLWRLLRFYPLTLPFLWTAVEVARSHVPYGGFPWLITGELLVDAPLLKNYLSAGGVYLGSVVVWSISLLPHLVSDRRSIVALLMLLLLPLPFIRPAPDPPQGVRVAVIQPNVEEDVKLDKEAFYRYLPNYWEILEKVSRERPDVVFLPESAFPFTANRLNTEGRRLLNYSRRFVIVTGLIDIRVGEDWEPYNSVFVLHSGRVVDFYDKVRLLPFGEYVPFPFGFTKDIFGAIGGTDYVPGSEPRCVNAVKLKVGTPICFEVSYYSLVRSFSECADVVAVFTNDGWFKDSDGTYQHFRQARVRAVENRKYLLWVNNTGPSAVISPEGDVLMEIPYGKKGYIVYDFSRIKP